MMTTAVIRMSLREIFDNIERALAYRDHIERELQKIDAREAAESGRRVYEAAKSKELSFLREEMNRRYNDCIEPGTSSIAGKLAPSPSAPAAGPPYPMFCRHPEKCAGKGSCPRDPNCCE